MRTTLNDLQRLALRDRGSESVNAPWICTFVPPFKGDKISLPLATHKGENKEGVLSFPTPAAKSAGSPLPSLAKGDRALAFGQRRA